MAARYEDAIDVACATYLALVTWARVFFLVAIRVLAVKLHIANEVLERLATFLERSSPSTVFGVLFENLGERNAERFISPPLPKTAFIQNAIRFAIKFLKSSAGGVSF